MKRRVLLLLPAFFTFYTAFSQYYNLTTAPQSLVEVNPSFAGSNGLLRVQSLTLISRWQAAGGSYNMYPGYLYRTVNAADVYIKPARAGIALSYISEGGDQFYKSHQASISYAQHISFFHGNLKLIPSLQFAYGTRWQYVLGEGDYLAFDIAPYRPQQVSYGALSTGFLFNFKTFYAGISENYIFNRKLESIGLGKLETVRNFYVSNNFSVGKKFMFNLSALVQATRFNSAFKLNLNTLILEHYIFGIGADVDDAWHLNAGYRHSLFSVQLAYRRSFGKTWNNAYYNGAQLTVSYNLRDKENRRKLTNFETW